MTRIGIGLAGVACTMVVSCTGNSATPWKPVTADKVQLRAPQNWTASPPPAKDPTVRLVLMGPREHGYPRSHLVLRMGSSPTSASMSSAVAAYERIGHLRHPTQEWNRVVALRVPGAKLAEELTGSYRVDDQLDSPLVHTLDIFVERNDGVPAHVFAVGSGRQIDARFVSKMTASLRLRA